jgi:hypothetical protein
MSAELSTSARYSGAPAATADASMLHLPGMTVARFARARPSARRLSMVCLSANGLFAAVVRCRGRL